MERFAKRAKWGTTSIEGLLTVIGEVLDREKNNMSLEAALVSGAFQFLATELAASRPPPMTR